MEYGVEADRHAVRDCATQLVDLADLWERLRRDGRVRMLCQHFYDTSREQSEVSGQVGEVSDRK